MKTDQGIFLYFNHLNIFQASRITVNANVMAWKSKGLSDESVKPPAMSDNYLSPTLDYFNNPKFQVQFNGSCLATNRAFTPNKIINLYIVFGIKSCPYYNDNSFTLKNYLFGSVKLTKNPDHDKYFYSGYGISFDVRETF